MRCLKPGCRRDCRVNAKNVTAKIAMHFVTRFPRGRILRAAAFRRAAME